MLGEFRTFIARGNVLDLAVAVIIGAAFAKITSSLTDDIIMPIVGRVFGGLDFSNRFILLGPLPENFTGNPNSYAELRAAGRRGARLGPVRDGHDQLPDPAVDHLPAGSLRQPDHPPRGRGRGPSEVELLTEIRDELQEALSLIWERR